MLISTEEIWWLAGQMSFCFVPISGALMTRSLYQGEEQKVGWGEVDDEGYYGEASEVVASDTLDKLMPTFGNYGGILWRGEASEVVASDKLDKLMEIYGNLRQLMAILEGYYGEVR